MTRSQLRVTGSQRVCRTWAVEFLRFGMGLNIQNAKSAYKKSHRIFTS